MMSLPQRVPGRLVVHMAIPRGADRTARRRDTTPDEIGSIAAAAGAKSLVLTHVMARSLRDLDDNLSRV